MPGLVGELVAAKNLAILAASSACTEPLGSEGVDVVWPGEVDPTSDAWAPRGRSMIRGASPFVTPLPNADNDFVRDELLASATWAGSEDDAPTEVIGSSTGVALTTDTGNDTAGRPAPATVHRITALTQRYLRAPVPAWPMSEDPQKYWTRVMPLVACGLMLVRSGRG